MKYQIRNIEESEYSKLEDFLYEAVFLPEGTPPPPKSIVKQPDLQVYVTESTFSKYQVYDSIIL